MKKIKIFQRKFKRNYYKARKLRRFAMAVLFSLAHYYVKQKYMIDFDALFLLIGIWYISEIKLR